MIINSKLILIVAIIGLVLALATCSPIAMASSQGSLPIKDIEQNLEIVESNKSDGSNSESTTSLAKKGNSQNSPVPPECPKKGPIPPNCTLKPKF